MREPRSHHYGNEILALVEGQVSVGVAFRTSKKATQWVVKGTSRRSPLWAKREHFVLRRGRMRVHLPWDMCWEENGATKPDM